MAVLAQLMGVALWILGGTWIFPLGVMGGVLKIITMIMGGGKAEVTEETNGLANGETNGRSPESPRKAPSRGLSARFRGSPRSKSPKSPRKKSD